MASPGRRPAPRGTHLLADIWGCDAARLDDVPFLEQLLRAAATSANATVLSVHVHRFSPRGVTAVALLAESHLSLHTWPEHGFAAVDVFTCGETMTPAASVAVIKCGLLAARHVEQAIARGEPE